MVCCDQRTLGESAARNRKNNAQSSIITTNAAKLAPSIDPVEISLKQFREENHVNSIQHHIQESPVGILNTELNVKDKNSNGVGVKTGNIPPYPIKLVPIVQPTSPAPPNLISSSDLNAWQCPGRNFFIPRGHWPWLVSHKKILCSCENLVRTKIC